MQSILHQYFSPDEWAGTRWLSAALLGIFTAAPFAMVKRMALPNLAYFKRKKRNDNLDVNDVGSCPIVIGFLFYSDSFLGCILMAIHLTEKSELLEGMMRI